MLGLKVKTSIQKALSKRKAPQQSSTEAISPSPLSSPPISPSSSVKDAPLSTISEASDERDLTSVKRSDSMGRKYVYEREMAMQADRARVMGLRTTHLRAQSPASSASSLTSSASLSSFHRGPMAWPEAPY